MTKTILAGAVAGAVALATFPAAAAGWSEKIDQCAAAVEAEGLATVSDYDVEFVSGASRTLRIELTPNAGGDSLVAECKISRGKVSEVSVEA